MCGFIFQKKIDTKIKLDKNLFKSAGKLIFNRGPDNQTFFFNNNFCILHARLNIIDLNTRSNQPMRIGNYNIIYNGEIYNFKELKQKLKKFYKFFTSSDTEVLLYSYLKWGEKMFEKINGMYSFVIYNFKKNEIFFSRDLFGQKPLYYFLNKKQFILSSEIKPIIRLLNDKTLKFEDKEINKYLNYNFYGDSKLTFFENIFQVPPGTFGYFKNNKLNLKKKVSKVNNTKQNDKTIFKVLSNEIKQHLISDVEVALLISDGIDSRSILDISEKLFKKKLRLFNLEFENFDNSKFKKTYLNKYKNYLITTKFLKKDLFKFLDKTSLTCETPTLGLFTIGLMKLFQNIKKEKIKVVLNGQGIDEIFGGYDLIFKSTKKNKIYHPSGELLSNGKFSCIKKKINNFSDGKNFISKRNKMSFQSKIPKNLNQYDKISMNYSVENRSPYLTPKLASIMPNLKLKQLYRNFHTKYLFRETMYKFTKKSFYFDKKLYEQSPQSDFLLEKKNLKKIKKILDKRNYCDRYFVKKNLKKYLRDFINKKNNGFIIWQYLSLNSFLNSFKNKF